MGKYDLDSFMNAPSDSARSSDFATGWKKDGTGETTVWLHRKTWAARTYNHQIPRVIEYTDKETKDKVLAVRNQRFTCHEGETVLKSRRFRDRKTGEREVPPCICPACILPEVVIDLVAKGEIGWLDPLFRWEGDDADEDHEVLATGLFNGFSDKHRKEMSREQFKAMKDAGVKAQEAFRQSILVRMQWLFLVLQAEHIENGIGITFEAESLGTKIKTAIRGVQKNFVKAGKSADLGDPTKNPYPFSWSFDNDKDFDDKYEVVALTETAPTPAILELIEGPVPDFEQELEPGNCWELKANLEAHYIGKKPFPWERVFGPAEKAGLMVPPEDSKADESGDEDDGDAPEVGRGKPQAPKLAALEVYEVGPNHDVWFEDAKPDPKVKGKRVHLEAPEAAADIPAATDEEIAAATQQLIAWGAAEVGLVLECDHCDGRMTSLDVDCPLCGAQYDEEGRLTGRPCLECKAPIEKVVAGEPAICPKCATIHKLGPEGEAKGLARWTKVGPPKPAVKVEEKAPPARRKRLEATPAAEPAASVPPEPEKPATRQRRGVPFDIKGATK